MGVSDGCCTTVVKVDDIAVSEPYDLSGLPESTHSFEFTGLNLKAGKHYITCEVVDKGYDEDYVSGWYLINAGGLILNFAQYF